MKIVKRHIWKAVWKQVKPRFTGTCYMQIARGTRNYVCDHVWYRVQHQVECQVDK